MKIFISYSRKDKDFVDQLANRLSDSGFDVWLDRWEIKVGDSLIDKMNEGLTDASHLAIVFSRNSIQSEWVRREINAAFFREVESKSIKVLPLRIDDCEIPSLMADKFHADFRDGFDIGFEQLIFTFSNINDEEEIVIEEVDFLVSGDQKKLGIEVLISNNSKTTKWFKITKLRAFVASMGAGLTYFYNKIKYRIEMRSTEINDAGQDVHGVIFEDDGEFGKQFSGYFSFINNSGSRTWEFEVEMPTHFRVPGRDKAAVRLFFEKPNKIVIEQEEIGRMAASTSFGISQKEFIISLVMDGDRTIKYQADDLNLLEFIANE